MGRDRRPYFLVPTISFGDISRSDSTSSDGFAGDTCSAVVVGADVSMRDCKKNYLRLRN